MTLNYQWLSSDETAQILGIRPLTLKRWRKEGKGPPYHKFSGWGSRAPAMYDRNQLDEWIKRRRADEVESS